MQRRYGTDEAGEEIGGAGLAVFAGAAGIPDGEFVDLDAGDGFDLFGDETGQLLSDHELRCLVGATCGGDDGLEAFGTGFELGQCACGLGFHVGFETGSLAFLDDADAFGFGLRHEFDAAFFGLGFEFDALLLRLGADADTIFSASASTSIFRFSMSACTMMVAIIAASSRLAR